MEDLHYIGNSPKRGDKSKIGMFGSGWKYALAWLIRNDCKPKIYSGLKEITIDTESIVTTKNMFDAIIVDGHKTSLTVQMGPEWEGWMALREIFSNAIDEGGENIKIDYKEPALSEGTTTVIIPANGELMHCIDHFEEYFCFNKTEHYKNNVGRVFIKRENSLMVVYRKGIRCYNVSHYQTKIDFDFYNIRINESRLTEIYEIDSMARILLSRCDDVLTLRASLESRYGDILPQELTDDYKSCITSMVAEGYVFESNNAIMKTPDALSIPKEWFWKLVESGILKNPIDEFFRTLKHEFYPVSGYEIEEAELVHYLNIFVESPTVKIGLIEAGYNTVKYFADGDKFIISEKFIKETQMSLKELAAELLIAQRDILKEYAISKM